MFGWHEVCLLGGVQGSEVAVIVADACGLERCPGIFSGGLHETLGIQFILIELGTMMVVTAPYDSKNGLKTA